MNRSTINMTVDIVIGGAFLLSAFGIRNDLLHIVAGIILVTGSIVHIALHWEWIVRHTKRTRGAATADGYRGKTSRITRVNYALDMTICSMFAVCAATGLALVFIDASWLTSIHTMSGGLFAIGTFAHMALKWKSLLTITKRALRTALGPRGRRRSRPAHVEHHEG